jgi:hypothetical protein
VQPGKHLLFLDLDLDCHVHGHRDFHQHSLHHLRNQGQQVLPGQCVQRFGLLRFPLRRRQLRGRTNLHRARRQLRRLLRYQRIGCGVRGRRYRMRPAFHVRALRLFRGAVLRVERLDLELRQVLWRCRHHLYVQQLDGRLHLFGLRWSESALLRLCQREPARLPGSAQVHQLVEHRHLHRHSDDDPHHDVDQHRHIDGHVNRRRRIGGHVANPDLGPGPDPGSWQRLRSG